MTSLAVHGHFYQPPRENPWTEIVGREASAGTYHDWNERITAECYRPNGWARIVDADNRTLEVVNNYAHLSFNVGPTLAVWLRAEHPDVWARIVEGDAQAFTAIAQPWHHAILPLALERDARTEIRWGITAFRHWFGRDPVGMWLPETALDDTVLGVLADEGIRFTIAAPGQIAGTPPGPIPGRWGRGDRAIDVVVFDGPLSQSLAFSLGSMPADRIIAAAHGPLTVAATDGETFGHHHHFTERAIAYALSHAAPEAGLHTGSVSALLDEVTARSEVKVHPSAWSCAHGLGRWIRDCGCSTGGEAGWNQQWRTPLRVAIDLVRDHSHRVFERRGAEVFRDPWAARDDYVSVLVDPSERDRFWRDHVTSGDDRIVVTLLELERHVLASYSSCGWFFNDLAGLETLQVLRYAARAFDLLAELDEPQPLAEFLSMLSTAKSNRPAEGNGHRIWERHVLTARVSPERLAAHVALCQLLGCSGSLGVFSVAVDVDHVGTTLHGVIEVTHRRTNHHVSVAVHAARGERGAVQVSASSADAAVSGGFDVLIPDLAPKTFATHVVSQAAALTWAAESLNDVRAIRQLIGDIANQGLSVDLAPLTAAYLDRFGRRADGPWQLELAELLGVAIVKS